MVEIPDTLSLRKDQRALQLLYVLCILLIMPYTFWYVDNPDSFQYISISQKICNGHFYEAINAYWSPLLSWILAVPVFLGADGISAFKILQAFIGLFAVSAFYRLSILFYMRRWTRLALNAAIIPFILSYACLSLSPDLLFLTLLLYLIIQLTGGDWLHNEKAARRIGRTGAILYLTKAFAFPFFIAIMIMCLLLSRLLFQREMRLRPVMTALRIFILLCACWIIPLSMKTGYPTISEAVKFNLSKEVAPLPGEIKELPVINGPLLPPPDEYALSAWESPGDAVHLNLLRPFQFKDDLIYYLDVIKRNLLSVWYYDFRNQEGFVFLILLVVFFFIRKRLNIPRNASVNFLLCFLLLFYGAYSLIIVHTRYVWICSLLMLLLSCWIWEQITRNENGKHLLRNSGLVLILLLAVKKPVKEILFTADADMPLLWIAKATVHPLETMEIHYRPDRFLKVASDELKQRSGITGRMASLKGQDKERQLYSSSLFLAYYLSIPYYGPLGSSLSPAEMAEELKKYSITVFLVWNNESWNPDEQISADLIYRNPDLGLSVYRLTY